ncbi:MAG: hypothetical protein NXI32_17365 [bacterium]|nr:hypothetical protein [bacterium]
MRSPILPPQSVARAQLRTPPTWNTNLPCADGKMLAVGMPIGPKDWIYLVDAETGEQRSILKSDMWKPWAVRFTQDGELLYSSGWDGAIRRWDVESAKELPLPKGIRATSSIAVAADGQRLAFVDGAGQVRIVDTKNGQQQWGFQPQHAKADRLQFAPDGQSIFVGGARDDTVAIERWSFDKQHMDSHWHWPVGEDPHSSLEALSITEDGKIVAGAVFRQHKAYVWEADTGKLLAELPHKSVYGLDVAADGKTLVTVGWDRMLRCWEVPSGKLLKQVAVMDFFDKAALRNADRRMYGVCYAPNGKRLAIAHMDGEVSIWNASDSGEPKLLHTFPAFRSFSYGALDFSPDGLWLAAGDSGGSVAVFDSFAGDKVLDVGRHQDLVYTVQFGRDATQLVSGGRNIGFLWNLSGDTQSSSDESHAQLWQDLASSNTDNVWHAVVAGKDQESWTAYVMDRLMSIQTVMDPESVTRSLDDEAKQRRLELLQKAVEQDSSVEYSKTVHRALSVLQMSPLPKCDEFLKWCAAQHPNETVRTLAARLRD